MALDRGNLQVQDKYEPIDEVELELKDGQPGRLFDLALELQASIPLHIENVSKAQRGYAYYRPAPPPVSKAKPVILGNRLRADEAFRHIGWECLGQLQGNHDMVLLGDDPEGIHQMRVALRRLRSAMGVFRAIINRQQCAGLVDELRWITGVLGTARDLDVFLTETLPPVIQQLDGHPGLLLLRDRALTAQHNAYIEVRAAIESQRYQRLLLTLGAWLEGGSIGNHHPGVLEIAEGMLRKRYKQLRRHGRLLGEMSKEERHLARIAGKKLRYTAEFFECLYAEDRTQPFLHRLASLQDVLGTLNDIAVTSGLIRRLAGNRPNKALDEALHIFSGWNGCYAMQKLAHMDNTWQAFAAQKPFWH